MSMMDILMPLNALQRGFTAKDSWKSSYVANRKSLSSTFYGRNSSLETINPTQSSSEESSEEEWCCSSMPLSESSASFVNQLLQYNPFEEQYWTQQQYNNHLLELRRRRLFSTPDDTHYQDRFVRCCIIRDIDGTRHLCPRYFFSFQSGNKEISMIAIKQRGNKRSNYHIFDAMCGCVTEFDLNKKSGNYIGKLKKDALHKSQNRLRYTLFNWSEDKEQVAKFLFQNHGVVEKAIFGSSPRSLVTMIPHVDEEGRSIPVKVTEMKRDESRGLRNTVKVMPIFDENNCVEMLAFKSRAPFMDSGQYRLNFNGRVKYPSVKNIQIENNNEELLVQFGRVGRDKFHLDYRTPINAFQAFALALVQFDI